MKYFYSNLHLFKKNKNKNRFVLQIVVWYYIDNGKNVKYTVLLILDLTTTKLLKSIL